VFHSTLLLAAAACIAASPGPTSSDPQVHSGSDLRSAVVQGHASWCHHVYAESARTAAALELAVQALVAHPSQDKLDDARNAWITARKVYGLSEALRYCDGPIETVEPALNSWPIDEAYIDAVVGRPDSGIINDPKRYPQIGEAVLLIANERGGETNVSVGWHAIEFLLWGQDTDPAGPGHRPFTDFVPGSGRNSARRCDYLAVVTHLVVQQLGDLAAAWAPDTDDYRRTFEKDGDAALHKMLTGAIVLTAFELHGERLAVAYATQDQEQEHSCFSDTTLNDLEADQDGITTIFTGERDDKRFGPGLLAYLRAVDAAIADDLQAKLARTRAALHAIPRPFDQAILGADDAPGRKAIRAALEALEAQTDALAIAGRALGFHLPLEPGG
jgi:putative iron-regulated protein